MVVCWGSKGQLWSCEHTGGAAAPALAGLAVWACQWLSPKRTWQDCVGSITLLLAGLFVACAQHGVHTVSAAAGEEGAPSVHWVTLLTCVTMP